MYKRFLARRIVPVSLATALLSFGSPANTQSSTTARVQAIRFWSFGDVTRVAIQTDGEYKLQSDQIENPPRVYFDLAGLRPPATAHRGVETIQVGDHRVKQIRVAEVSPGRTRIVFDLEGPADIVSSQLVNPDRLMIEVRPKGIRPSGISIAHNTMGSHRADLSDPPAPKTDPAPVQPVEAKSTAALVQTLPPPHTAAATAAASTSVPRTREVEIASPAKSESDGDRSLVRVFGLKLGKVVIDAGHGGHDTGTVGRNGLMEKDLVLDVALRLGKLITQKLGAEVVYTRSSDVFIPLEERTKIADAEKADLFISIHANSSPDAKATGVETYYFNLTSDKSGLDLATRENATSTSSISDLNDLLHKAVLQNKLEESREFAQKVQTALWTSSVRMNRQSRDRGVRQAPFVVLIGATMPSILAEIGFVSNSHDERLMKRSDQRQKIAEALYRGISQYANTLSHVQMARTRTE